MPATRLNDVSGSAIDSHRSAVPLSHFAAELSTKAHKPVLKRLDEVLGSPALYNLCLRQAVSQSLTLGISHDGARLEENGDDICSRQKKKSVSPDRTSQRRRPARLEADHNQAKKKLPDTLPFYRVSEQQICPAGCEVQDDVQIPVEETARDDHEAVNRRGIQSPFDIGL